MKNPARLIEDEHGGLSVEAVIVLPVLFWALMATYVFFDAYGQRNTLTKATYTVADLLSRETRPIDEDYLDGVHTVLRHLSGAQAGARVRVTVVHCTDDCLEDDRVLDLDWSQASEGLEPLTASDLNRPEIADQIPLMAAGARAIVVQAAVDFDPLFSVGLPTLTLGETVVVRPRFAPRLCWDSCLGAGTS